MEFNRPKFALAQSCELVNIQPLGRTGEHLKYTLRIAGEIYQAVQWRTQISDLPSVNTGEKIKILFRLSINKYQGRKNLQIEIIDWHITNTKYYLKTLWGSIKSQDKLTIKKSKRDLARATGASQSSVISGLKIFKQLKSLDYQVQDNEVRVQINKNKPENTAVDLSELEKSLY